MAEDIIKAFNIENRLVGRIGWLIRLRWIAVVSLFSTLVFVSRVLALPLPYTYLYAISIFLGLYNAVVYTVFRKLKGGPHAGMRVNLLANVQISIDLLCLAAMIHFSGGVENPFVFYFIFHMIIAGILLSRMASYFQATYAILLFLAVVLLECIGLLPHYCLGIFGPISLHDNPFYVTGISFVFISTLYIAVYMATSISTQLRHREQCLREANAMLREKDRIKSEYVLRVSHDIKESLAAIQSCVEPVADKMLGKLNDEQHKLLVTAKERSQRLIEFVNALLEITRLKLSKEIKMEGFSLKKMINTLSKDIQGRASAQGISFILEMDSVIDTFSGVKVYLEEAIMNILVNALKYTPSGGKIILQISGNIDNICINIIDSGVGIPPGDLPHVFEEFYRAGNVKKIERLGTGLGLAFAKEIIEMHKGGIQVSSELNVGTLFLIKLPKKVT